MCARSSNWEVGYVFALPIKTRDVSDTPTANRVQISTSSFEFAFFFVFFFRETRFVTATIQTENNAIRSVACKPYTKCTKCFFAAFLNASPVGIYLVSSRAEGMG